MTTQPCIKCNAILPSEADPFIEGVCSDCRNPEVKVIVNDKPAFRQFRPIEIIQAIQWFKNGDHPEDYDGGKRGFKDGKPYEFSEDECRIMGWEGHIVRYFRQPGLSGDTVCPICEHRLHDHGWIENNLIELGFVPGIVCPGDWIISVKVNDRRKYRIVGNKEFQNQYTEIK